MSLARLRPAPSADDARERLPALLCCLRTVPGRGRQRGRCHLPPTLPSLRARRFLRYCRAEGGYTGYPYEDESPAEDGLAADLQALRLGN